MDVNPFSYKDGTRDNENSIFVERHRSRSNEKRNYKYISIFIGMGDQGVDIICQLIHIRVLFRDSINLWRFLT